VATLGAFALLYRIFADVSGKVSELIFKFAYNCIPFCTYSHFKALLCWKNMVLGAALTAKLENKCCIYY
jgi:hypothetical protein